MTQLRVERSFKIDFQPPKRWSEASIHSGPSWRKKVRVLRPQNVHGVDQIFVRDVGFVIDDQFVVSSMIEDRQREWEGVQPLLGGLNVLQPPTEVHVEGEMCLFSHTL